MSIAPIVTFKAGQCDFDADTGKVKANPTKGYIYLYSEDDLIHFCWRSRAALLDNPELDLVMVPTDGTFKPLEAGPNNGRIYVLRFSSSSQRHFFWLQSKTQDPKGNHNFWSARDKKLGKIVNTLLQGEDVDVQTEIATAQRPNDDDGDDDATMEDVEGTSHNPVHHRGGSGGAGPGATGGDVREEGEEAREGGADGGRAAALPQDASTIVQNFLRSMGSTNLSQQQQQYPTQERLFTTLADLLTPTTTLPVIDQADTATVDRYLDFLPPSLLSLAQEPFGDTATVDHPSSDTAIAAKEALSLSQKKNILCKVLRSPQFSQSLSSLTIALRDGGLPSIGEALGVPVLNGGYIRRGGGMPLGGGDAVEAFVEGVKKQVQEEPKKDGGQGGKMDVD